MDSLSPFLTMRRPAAQTAAGTPPTVEQLLKKPEAAKLLGISQRTLEIYLHDGRLPSVKFGAACRIDPRDLRKLIDSLKITGSSGSGDSTTEGEE